MYLSVVCTLLWNKNTNKYDFSILNKVGIFHIDEGDSSRNENIYLFNIFQQSSVIILSLWLIIKWIMLIAVNSQLAKSPIA